jgi:hypothetical protein
MISFLPVASEWTGQWGASFWSGLDIVGHVLGKVRKLCGGGWIEAVPCLIPWFLLKTNSARLPCCDWYEFVVCYLYLFISFMV